MAEAHIQTAVPAGVQSHQQLTEIVPSATLGLVDADGRWRLLEGAAVHEHVRVSGEKTADEILVALGQELQLGLRAAAAGEPFSFEYESANGPVFSVQLIPVADESAVAAVIVTDITVRVREQTELLRLAKTDELTGLPNRSWLRQRLSEAPAGGLSALLRLDLDRFKAVNDTLGHEHGDALLCEVARRLEAVVKGYGEVARLAGDEFAIILADPEVAVIAARVLSALSEPINLDGMWVFSSASIGVTLISSVDADTLLGEADLAMYAAKNAGGNTYCLFELTLARRAQARRALGIDLHNALEREEFSLSYQPQFDIRNGEIVSVEALLRWERPHDEAPATEEFITVAQQSGLMVPLGEWVLGQACRQARSWQQAGMPVRVAVNICEVQLRQPGFTSVVAAALAATELPAQLLELEITESALSDELLARTTLAALKDLGVRLTIDDFGTGYSSLARLKQFPVDILKIDKAFVRGLGGSADDEAIARAVIALAQAFNLTVMAEGVENEEQRQFLLAAGCDWCSGWLFSPALPAQQLSEFMATSPKSAKS